MYCNSVTNDTGHYICNETNGAKICLADYHGLECDVFCSGRNDSNGHYYCDKKTGKKTCHANFMGKTVRHFAY